MRWKRNTAAQKIPPSSPSSTNVYFCQTPSLGCPENAKSLKSQAPQGFSGCLDIENDEMNKKNFLSASPRVN